MTRCNFDCMADMVRKTPNFWYVLMCKWWPAMKVPIDVAYFSRVTVILSIYWWYYCFGSQASGNTMWSNQGFPLYGWCYLSGHRLPWIPDTRSLVHIYFWYNHWNICIGMDTNCKGSLSILRTTLSPGGSYHHSHRLQVTSLPLIVWRQIIKTACIEDQLWTRDNNWRQGSTM